MTTLYRDIHALTQADVDDMSQYQELFDKATSFQTWFKSRKKVANSMKQAATKTAWSTNGAAQSVL